MAQKTAAQVAQKWKTNTSNSGTAYRDGIEGVTVSPTAKAALAIDRQVQGVQRAAAEGRTQAALNNVTLSDWKAAAINKGLSRLTTGVQQAETKMARAMSVILPVAQQIKDHVATMPRGTLADSAARAMYAWEAMRAIKGRTG